MSRGKRAELVTENSTLFEATLEAYIYIPPHLFPAFSFTRQRVFSSSEGAMDTTAPDQARVVLDIWSTMLTRYLAAAGLVVVLYDCLLTIEDEVCPIFSRRGAVSVYFLLAEAPCLARGPEFTKSLVLH